MIQYIKKAVLIVIAIIASIGIQLNINMDICIWNRFSGNYMISLILCFFIFDSWTAGSRNRMDYRKI